MAALNAYLVGVIRGRWAARLAGQRPEGGDILDRILAALEVRGRAGPGGLFLRGPSRVRACVRVRFCVLYRGACMRTGCVVLADVCVVCVHARASVCAAHTVRMFFVCSSVHVCAASPAQSRNGALAPLHRAQTAGTKWDASIETQLCYELKTFLLAGHETSAAMLTWSVYELSQNGEARDKVRARAGGRGGLGGHPPRDAAARHARMRERPGRGRVAEDSPEPQAADARAARRGPEPGAGAVVPTAATLAALPCVFGPQVAAEAELAFGPDNATPSRRAADEMAYTLSVLKEALRK
jgi:hypothetical protein